MKICLISSEHSPWGGLGHSHRRLAAMLASRHEVTLIQSGGSPGDPATPEDSGVNGVFAQVSPDLAETTISCEDHQRSAAVLEAIEQAYGSAGPDYLEVPDYHAHGLVPLQARRAGHPLLRNTFVGVRISSTAELIGLFDGTLNQPGMRLVCELEREQFRLADCLLWAGGSTLDLYRRYYADLTLPQAFRIRRPFAIPPNPPTVESRNFDQKLRILFVGRLQQFKGVIDLVEACQRLPVDGWELTMIGADTLTAPMGQSVRMTIETICGDDPRFRLDEALPHDELQRRWTEHDLLVVPSRFEVWGNVALEAMRAGLPVLATPVDGLTEIVEPGVTGWHTDGLDAEAISRALLGLLENREELERVRASGAVFKRFLRLTDPHEALKSYDHLLNSAASRRATPHLESSHDPLATAIVPYHGSSAYVKGAVESLLAQTHRNLEVLIVNDGSFAVDDDVLVGLATDPRVSIVTQLNRGEPSARNLGACIARGEYLVMVDADNAVESDFVARAIEVLRREPELAYVTCWLRFINSDGSKLSNITGYAPLGNRVVNDDTHNWDGDATAVLPRKVFSELGYRYEPTAGLQSDWELYRCLRDDGRFGAVIPERLARYRVHPDSLLKTHRDEVHRRSWDEALTRRLLRRAARQMGEV